ncbi:MAG: hypothetical protein ACQXXH_01990 [Candidatus Bathyarchaeia archaeon]|jgi:hypothetical protein|nr:hypothetical protein [Candidatus Bathyarchaeota archaeon A05DMB-4]MDH7594516.1 dockerin type I domain-containing protein [Candidatus Bathyarchaeota archaeon]
MKDLKVKALILLTNCLLITFVAATQIRPTLAEEPRITAMIGYPFAGNAGKLFGIAFMIQTFSTGYTGGLEIHLGPWGGGAPPNFTVTMDIDLPAGQKTAVFYYWNSSGYGLGTYWMSAQFAGMPWTIYYDGGITLSIPGDINGDGIVNIKDATIIGLNWLRGLPHPRPPWWNPQADVALPKGIVDDNDRLAEENAQTQPYESKYDLVYDGVIDDKDLLLVLIACTPTPSSGPANWNHAADLNDDGIINIMDATIIALNWMRRIPP